MVSKRESADPTDDSSKIQRGCGLVGEYNLCQEDFRGPGGDMSKISGALGGVR